MTDPTNTNYHPGTILPEDNKPITPSDMQVKATDQSSDSAWAKMFPAGATKEELNQFINTYVQDMIREMKRADERHKKNIEEQKMHEKGIY